LVTEEFLHFENKNKDLNQLAREVIGELDRGGYTTQYARVPVGMIIQAKRRGSLADGFTGDRAITCVISGEPDDFIVHLGIAKWARNMATAALDPLFLSSLFLTVDVQEVLWSRYVEEGIVNKIAALVG
jgi:hypothetical protein